jgi:hypothetical protein
MRSRKIECVKFPIFRHCHLATIPTSVKNDTNPPSTPLTQSHTTWVETFWSYLTVLVFAEMKREEAITLRNQNIPTSLFRYRPLSKEREFENIERQQVWLSQTADANDPYDTSLILSHANFVWPEQAQAENVARFAPLAQDRLDSSEIAEFASFPDLPDERDKFLIQKAIPEIGPEEANRILCVVRKVTTASALPRGRNCRRVPTRSVDSKDSRICLAFSSCRRPLDESGFRVQQQRSKNQDEFSKGAAIGIVSRFAVLRVFSRISLRERST